MKHISLSVYRRIAFLVLLMFVVSVMTTFAVVPRARATTQDCGSWHVYPSPPMPQYGGLYGVAVSSYTNVWAVGAGYIPSKNAPINSGVIERWDGLGWHTVASPQPANYRNDLSAVSVLSVSDAWAVGSDQNAAGGYEQQQRTLIEHWNGTAWGVVSSPSRPVFLNHLSGVVALSTTDVWAVGESSPLAGQMTTKTLVEHWNGSSWSIVASPTPKDGGAFSAVTAFAPNDIWAVGTQFSQFNFGPSLIEHWNGQQWSIVPSPTAGVASEFRAVSGSSPNSIWAVGDYIANGGYYDLVEYWNGSTWSIVPIGKFPQNSGDLGGVLALRANDVWAVGGSDFGGGIYHWDGQQWSGFKNPGEDSFLTSIAGRNRNDLWAVGGVIMHFCHG